MLNLLVAISLWSFWIGFIGFGLLLFCLRVIKVTKDKKSLIDSLSIVFLPCSIGFYLRYKVNSTFKRNYHILIIIQFILMLLGSIMIFYIHFA